MAKSPLSMRVFEGKNRFPSFSAPDPRVSQQQAQRVLPKDDRVSTAQHGLYAEVCKDSVTGFAEVRDQRESWHIDG